MWARVIQMMLALWMVVSPWVFGHWPDQVAIWANDLACGFAIFVLAALSFWTPTRYAYLGTLVVGGWMAAFAYFYGGYPADPGWQNQLLVSMTQLVLGIIPNRASEPPPRWKQYWTEIAASPKGSQAGGRATD